MPSLRDEIAALREYRTNGLGPATLSKEKVLAIIDKYAHEIDALEVYCRYDEDDQFVPLSRVQALITGKKKFVSPNHDKSYTEHNSERPARDAIQKIPSDWSSGKDGFLMGQAIVEAIDALADEVRYTRHDISAHAMALDKNEKCLKHSIKCNR